MSPRAVVVVGSAAYCSVAGPVVTYLCLLVAGGSIPEMLITQWGVLMAGYALLWGGPVAGGLGAVFAWLASLTTAPGQALHRPGVGFVVAAGLGALLGNAGIAVLLGGPPDGITVAASLGGVVSGVGTAAVVYAVPTPSRHLHTRRPK